MSGEKVTFKTNGEYTFGTPLSEMDVNNVANTPGDSKGAASPAGTPGAAAAPRTQMKKFNLSNLKKNAGVPDDKKKSKGEKKKVEQLVEEKASVAEQPVREPEVIPTPEPVQEPKEEPAPTPVVEEPKEEPAPTPVVEEPKEEPATVVVPEPEPSPEPEVAAEQSKEEKEFKLAQLGLSPEKPVEKPVPEVEVEPKVSVSEMNLSTVAVAPAVEPAPVAEEPKEPAPVVEPVKEEPTPVVEETKENAPEFVFHSLQEFLDLTGITERELSDFAGAVLKASLRGTSIWQSKRHSTLRAYSCVPVSGRRVPSSVRCLLTVGWDVHVTACYISDKLAISDGTANLECIGICAYVQGTPVALSTERNRKATIV